MKPTVAPTRRSVRFNAKELWLNEIQSMCVVPGCTNRDAAAVFHVAGHVHRGGCKVLPGRVGSGSGPSPQSGHHLQGPQT